MGKMPTYRSLLLCILCSVFGTWGVVKRDILWCFWGALKWGGKTPPHPRYFLAEFLCPNCRQPFLLPEKNRSVPRSCPYKHRENFYANLIGEISLNGNLSYHRKSGNTPRLSRYSCRACSRSSAVGAVLYFAYSSCHTIASNFFSNP